MIRIWVGCSPNNEDLESQSVLEWSLRKHHPANDIEIVWMQLSHDPSSAWYSDPLRGLGWNSKGWATPFSAFRWAVPAACNYEGRSIYMDSDMIAMADIAELWNQEFRDGYPAISKGKDYRFCVTLFDNARMRQYVPDVDALKASDSMYRTLRGIPVQKFVGNWNCLDGEKYSSITDPDIKMLHYTAIPTQLHLKYSLPRIAKEGGRHWFTGKPQAHPRKDLQKLFDDLLVEAIANGYPPERYRKEPYGDYRTMWKAA